jgi:hypothetical protein
MAGFVEGVDRGQSTLFLALARRRGLGQSARAVDVLVDGLELDRLSFVGVQSLDTGRPGYYPGYLWLPPSRAGAWGGNAGEISR